GFLRTKPRIPSDEELHPSRDPRPLLPRVFAQIKAGTGNDFSHYKQSTIMRRIRRRMQLAHIEELEEYLAMLRAKPDEVHALSEDFLITVTSFFRDTAVFQRIESEI